MQNKNMIKFGTDGWRAVIGDDYTFENLKIVSQAVADYLGKGKQVSIGYDTRFMSDRFAELVAEVLSNNGIKVLLSDRAIPTPALSLTVKSRRMDLGVMITASHNPAEYNGFKIKDATGGSASPEITQKIEGLLGKNAAKERNSQSTAIKKEDLTDYYIKFIRRYINLKAIRNKKFKVLVDVMYGAGDSFIAQILKGTDIQLAFRRNEINPSFGKTRPEPVEENLGGLKDEVRKGMFDLGIALDGDADRIAAVAPGGIFIHPQKILGLLALHLNQDRHWSGGIVKTICGTAMIDNIADFLKVKLYETPVGFKYISNLMEKEDIVAGGEEAGGMGVKNYIPERDGTMAGLLLLEMMAYRKKNILKIINEVEKQFGRYYYVRQDLHLKGPAKEPARNSLPENILGKRVVEIKDYDGIKLIFQDKSWLMLRASGTEPIMRLYAEARSLRQANLLLSEAKRLVNPSAIVH
jgi:phosphomannomutase